MKTYMLRRLVWGVAGIFVITCLNFIIIKMVPGDPVRAMLGEYPVPQEYIDRIRVDLGLDQPIYIQFVYYFSNLLQGDFGFSFANRYPVLPLILEKAQITLLLVLPVITISFVLGVGLALLSVRKVNGPVDNAISTVVIFGHSLPSFWLGQILVLVFAAGLSWFPSGGMQSVRERYEGFAAVLDVGHHIVLPMLCLICFKLAVFLRVGRASVIGVMNDDYIHTARAKGASERRIMMSHVVPNAIIPMISVLGYSFGHALTTSILTETVFAWPGIGSLFVSSIASRDFPVLQGILILSTVLVVMANLLADLLSALADPRIRRNLGGRHG